MKKVAIILMAAGLYSVAGAGTMVIEGWPGNVHRKGYIVFVADLTRLSDSWPAKIGDPHLDPCADLNRSLIEMPALRLSEH